MSMSEPTIEDFIRMKEVLDAAAAPGEGRAIQCSYSTLVELVGTFRADDLMEEYGDNSGVVCLPPGEIME